MIEFGHRVSVQSQTHDLFAGSGLEVQRVPPRLPEIPDWPNMEKLNREKAALGFYISGHPLDRYRDELASFSTATLGNLEQVVDGKEVTVGGVLAKINRMLDKKGNQMAFATLEDFSGKTELILFSDCYEKGKEFLEVDRMVLVTGRVNTREGERPKIIGNEVLCRILFQPIAGP